MKDEDNTKEHLINALAQIRQELLHRIEVVFWKTEARRENKNQGQTINHSW